MKRKLIITTYNSRVLTASMEDGEIRELHADGRRDENRYALGNIYIGKVKKIVSNIHAAFIEIGKGMECYYSLDEKGGKTLRAGDECMVQIHKEAVKTKQPSVTRNISLAGKYCVLTSGDRRIGVSGKIESEKREELKEAMQPLKNPDYGFIIRTNAKDCETEELLREAGKLAKEYESLLLKSETRVCYSCLKESEAPYLASLRNIYQEGLEEIVVEDQELYHEIHDYLERNQPEDLAKLKHYADPLLPLHKLYSIETALQNALKEKVWMKSGAYLVIQPTEALTVIDVNTGKCTGKKRDDTVYFKINLEAAKEAAKQIRLRNLSGIILIDFINMDDAGKMEQLIETFRSCLKRDPVQADVVDVTKLQLVEVTRKKIRKPLHEALAEEKGRD